MKLPRRSRAPQKGDAVKRSYAEDRLGYLTVEESVELEHLWGVAPAQVPHMPMTTAQIPRAHRRTQGKAPKPHGSCTGHLRNGLTQGHDPNCGGAAMR